MDLKKYRKKHKLTQKQFGLVVGLGWEAISKVERGIPVGRHVATTLQKWSKGKLRAAVLMGLERKE